MAKAAVATRHGVAFAHGGIAKISSMNRLKKIQ
jgi:hypothetical protein